MKHALPLSPTPLLASWWVQTLMSHTAEWHPPMLVRPQNCVLKRLGVRISMDDYWTAYSSLSYCGQFLSMG